MQTIFQNFIISPHLSPSGTTTQLSGGDSPERQHQRFSSVRSNDLLAERRTDRTRTTPHPQPPERLRTDRSPLARPSPTTAWALSPPQTTLKPLPQQTIFWALWGSQITLKDECKVSMRSQLTTQLSGGDSPERQHQRFSSVRSNDLLAERRTDRTRTTPHPQPPERLRTDRSPLARPSPTTAWALSPPQTTLKPLPQQTIFWALWGSQITLKDECKVSMRSQLTTQLSGGDSPERQHQRFSSVRSNDLLAERRTDRTRTTPHPQPPERLRTDRSPLARPSPTTAWALSPPQTTLKPLPQQTIFWALWGSQITLKDECKVSMRSQLTID